MVTLTNLNSRLDRLEEQLERTPVSRRHYLLFVRPGENAAEAIERQKRELGVRDDDAVRVVEFVALPARAE